MFAHGTIVAVASVALLSSSGVQTGGAALRPSGAPTGTHVEPVVPRDVPSVRFELPPQQIVLPSGVVADFGPHEIWKPICTTGRTPTQDELEQMALSHRLLAERPVVIIDNTPEIGSFNVVFSVSGSVPSGAAAALAAAEAYIESFFSDPITITINCSFQPLGPGILGSTGSSYGYVNYGPMRTQIVGDMDASDTLQSSLPTGTTIKVRYGTGTTVTNETRVFTTYANWKALDGTVAGADASMTFSTNFAFDYDPSNGVGGSSYSFRDIVIHEVGHAMGFTSGADFRVNDMEVLDLYRFQTTDGTGDYNPDTLAEWTARPRLVDYNAPNDAHHSDLAPTEYRMSDGSPYQASHFREQDANIGLMDPALAPGQTFHPNYYSTADVAMFDVIGYDR
jgi:hypothetical protein